MRSIYHYRRASAQDQYGQLARSPAEREYLSLYYTGGTLCPEEGFMRKTEVRVCILNG
jgi:hypothetical protein